MTSPVPNIIKRDNTVATPSAKTKSADPSIILFDDESYPAAVLEKLLFEDISGQELLSIARTTDLSGAFVSNRLIGNASDLALKYNPENIIYIPDSLPNFFKNFSIDLFSKLPSLEGQYFGLEATGPNLYFDTDTNSVVIEFEDLFQDEQVEVEILSSADIFNDTIDVNYAGAEFSI